MLIVSNGAPKSGSYWLLSICERLTPFEPPDSRWNTHGWKNPTVAPERLGDFLASMEGSQTTVLFKAHYNGRHNEPRQLTAFGARIAGITRYLSDAAVSMVHHAHRHGETTLTLEQWAGEKAAGFADMIVQYLRTWKGIAFDISYEALLADTNTEIMRLASYLGMACDDTKAGEIARVTDFRLMQQTHWAPKHFREGLAGRSREVLPPDIFAALDAMDDYTDRDLLARAALLRRA